MRKVIPKDSVQENVKNYIELGKLRLTSFVILSALMGFCIGSTTVDVIKAFWLCLGGLLITMASNAMNQIYEIALDSKMVRTQNRPLPLGKLTVKQAQYFATFSFISGYLILSYFLNVKVANLSMLSLVMYVYAYTPLKTKSSFAVFVGAFPGALPPMIGYVAATNQVDTVTWLIFGIQFLWQFPHFWAIAWLAFEDYQKAGIHLLPSKGGKDFYSALQIVIYTVFLVAVSILPYLYGAVGLLYLILACVTGTIFIFQAVNLLIKRTRQAALQLMFGSFFYLPTILITFYFDKI